MAKSILVQGKRFTTKNQTRPQMLKGYTDLPGGRISFHKMRTIKTF